MPSVRRHTIHVLQVLVTFLIVWNTFKAVNECIDYTKTQLRLRRIRIQGNSGTTRFSTTKPEATR